jgi:Protein of unknown function (DUF4019)
MIRGSIHITAVLSFVFGLIFVSTLLVLAVAIPNPTEAQLQTFRTVLALAAAGIGAVLPGFIEVRYRDIVRASGALALFAIIYFFSPQIQRPLIKVVIPAENPQPIANHWLTLNDAADIQATWSLLDSESKTIFLGNSFERFAEVFRNARLPLGRPLERKLVSQATFRSDGTDQMMPPKGAYADFNYNTKFANAAGCRAEFIRLRAVNDKWVIFSYLVSQNRIECVGDNTEASS